MEQIHDYDDACERYLLGELSEPEQVQLEEAYFADDALFERFRAVKDSLIDAYARGDLTGQKRERFEQHFLASEPRRQRVEEAKDFIRVVTAASPHAAPADRSSLVHATPAVSLRQSISRLFVGRPLVWQGALAALLLIAVAGSWVLVRRLQGRQAEHERLQNEQAARRQQDAERGQAVVPPVTSTTPTATPAPDFEPQPRTTHNQVLPPKPAQIASLLLTPFSPRDATASNSLLLGPNTKAVRLRLAFKGDDYRRYDVVLRTLDGEQVFARRGLHARSNTSGKSVTLTVDPFFHRQDYIITLSGLTTDGKLEAIGDYYFRIERSPPQ